MISQYDHLTREELIRLLEARGQSRMEKGLVEKFALAFHACPDPILITRQHDGKIIEANEAFDRVYGVPAPQVVGRTSVELGMWSDLEARRRMVEVLQQKGRVRDFECVITVHSGERLSGVLSAEPIQIEGEACLVVVFRDVTLQKQAEQSLRESEARFHSLAAAAFEGICISEAGRVLDGNDQLAQMLGYTLEELTGRPVLDLVAPESRPLVEEMIRQGRPGPYEHLSIRKDGSTFPVEVQARPLSLGKRQLRVTSIRDITARKRAEEQIRRNELRLRVAIDTADLAVFEMDRNLRYTWMYSPQLGYAPEQVIGRTDAELLGEDGIQIMDIKRRVLESNQGAREEIHVRHSGKELFFDLTMEPTRSATGEVTGLRGASADITARKAAEESFRTSEERLRATVENTPHVAVQWYDAAGIILFWNQASEAIFGWKTAEAVGKTLDQLIHSPEEAAAFRQVLAEIGRTGRSVGPAEYHFRRRDGAEGVCLSTTFRIPTGTGQFCFVCMDVDITAQRRAAEALRASEERFELAVRGSNDAIWDWDIRADRIYYSPRFHELLGYGPGEFPEVVESFSSRLHPEDQDRVWKGIHAHLENCAPYDEQFRLRTRSGDYRWFRARAQAVWDDTGKAVRMAGSLTDIHEHKMAGESLRRAQEQALIAHEDYTQRLISAQEQERKRLANELHDSLGQNLSLIKNRAWLAAQDPGVPAGVAAHLQAISEVVTDAIGETRNLAQNLRPLHIDRFGLTDALENLVQQAGQSVSIPIEHRLEDVDDLFHGEEATNIYRIVQEALNNLVKHAQATRAAVRLERDVHLVRISVEDDGRGFDPNATAASRHRTGIGLTSIGERTRMLGGTFEIDSAPGKGTRIRIELPIPAALAPKPDVKPARSTARGAS